MSNDEPKRGLLEIVHNEEGELMAYCPYREQTVAAKVCFACKDFAALALSPDGKTSYVACERADKDGVWAEGGGDRPAVVHKCETCGAEIVQQQSEEPAAT